MLTLVLGSVCKKKFSLFSFPFSSFLFYYYWAWKRKLQTLDREQSLRAYIGFFFVFFYLPVVSFLFFSF